LFNYYDLKHCKRYFIQYFDGCVKNKHGLMRMFGSRQMTYVGNGGFYADPYAPGIVKVGKCLAKYVPLTKKQETYKELMSRQ
jgi:hypothetical protein